MMEYGIKIISEKTCIEDINICNYYSSVHFIEMIDNLDQLIDAIEYVKNIQPIHNLKELEDIFKEDMYNVFKTL